MSYPSVKEVLTEKGINTDTASNEQLATALWDTFNRDLSLGVNHLVEIAKKVKGGGIRVLDIQDPGSSLGKQLIRLIGTDIARAICSQKLGVSFGIYNCCGVVSAPSESELNMTMHEQINLQNGVLATADC